MQGANAKEHFGFVIARTEDIRWKPTGLGAARPAGGRALGLSVDVADGDAAGLDATHVFLQIALGYILGRIVIAWTLLPRYHQGELVTAYALLSDLVAMRD